MSATAWLVAAVLAGLVFAALWVAREVWIRRRRRRDYR